MSDVSVDIIKNRSGEAPDLPSGANLSGVSTAATLQVTNLNPTHINASGVTTATTFSGSLKSTGTPTLGLGVTINSSGINISGVATAGIVSATTLYGDGSNLTGVAMSIAPISYNPDVNDTLATIDTGIGITFTKRVIAGSGNVTLRLVGAAGTVVENFGVGSSVTISNNNVSITPTANLEGNTVYHLSYPSGAFTNTGGDVSYVGTAYTFDTRSLQYELWSCGGDDGTQFGILGDNSEVAKSSPVQIPGTNWGQVVAGTDWASAIKTDGTLWTWGRNQGGELGDNSVVSKSSPVQVPGTTWGYLPISGGELLYHVLATKTDGTLWSWGYGIRGALGQNQGSVRYSSPVQVPGTTWTGNLSGQYNTGAIKTDGTLWSWGYNNVGQLAQNNTTDYSSPVQIPGTTWNKIVGFSAGVFVSTKTDGTLWTWGWNGFGALGVNDGTNRSSPVQVPGTTWGSELGNTNYGPLCIKTDGTLWTWGDNDKGQLGQNDVVRYSSPVQVPGTTWSKVGGSSRSVWASKTDGTLWSWGYNNYGTLGQNQHGTSTNCYSSPVQIPGTWDPKQMEGAKLAMFAIKTV